MRLSKLLGSTDKSVTSSGYLSCGDGYKNNSGLLGNTRGITNEETDSFNFMVTRWLVQGLWLRENLNRDLEAMIHGLVMIAMIHFLLLMFWQLILYKISNLDDYQ